MAADSGHHSCSLPRIFHNDDSSETSETSESCSSFDLQESGDDFTPSEGQALVNVCFPECLTTTPDPPSNPEPAIPRITSTTANKGRCSTKVNFSRKANAISRANASTKTSFLIKSNVFRKSRGTTRVQKAALPKSQPTTLNIFRNDDSSHDIESLLGPAGLEAALAQHFKIVVNMMEHMNFALFHSEAKHGIKQSAMREVKGMAEEMIYFFDGLQGSFRSQMEEIKDTHSYLPALDDHVEEHHLKAAIKVWAERFCEKVGKPRKCEQQLLNRFAGVYDANVYSPFLQLRRRNARHNICELSVHLDSIYHATEGAIELYEQIIQEMGGVRQALERAFDDFRRLPHAWLDWWGYERFQASAQGHVSEATTPSVPGTLTTLTYAESADKARLSTVTSLHTKALDNMALATEMKREDI